MMLMKRWKSLHIHSGAIKSALDPLKPYIAATIVCGVAAWILFNLSEEAEPGSSAAVRIATVAHALVWITASAAISHVVLFTLHVLRDARSASENDESISRR